ncbi:MAG: DNA repair and recombination protein RadA [Methanomicrobium sp.]|jgi:DNA repair and recombination protein RadA|nr:DNA repair and recombination protein RadA [Methanomicrobium sp.]MBQ4415213.1 DNA repair and recombination protein RadA [Methanomicrobium sp.]MBR6011136.1 DNA repair and recombination protein RadA [Methanomicrobium sp.]MBR6447012.1 DNA repair and recombination protein RadA [Methanomicrobium sp.]
MSEHEIEDLPGVGPTTADKLRDSGYCTIESIATASYVDLAEDAEIGEATAKKMIKEARKMADIGGFRTGIAVLEERKEVRKLSTLVPELDELMGGGLETMSIIEFYGEFGSGKSQISHQMAVNAQLPYEVGGLQGSVVYVDTENTFRPERIRQMVEGLEVDCEVPPVEDFLEHIHVAEAFTSDHQMLLIDNIRELAAELKDTDRPVKLIIVDSLMAHFRAEYAGRGTLSARQQKLNKYMYDLAKVAKEFNSVIIVTNQVQSNPAVFFGDPTKPTGGNIVGHASKFRVYLRKSKGGKRVAKLVDSPDQPEGEAAFSVEMAGLKSV